ncbi:acetyltransferase domain-containing protein [Nemania serpens]|nr:acetyltransferase domain-containing protein [Nemania serpens]
MAVAIAEGRGVHGMPRSWITVTTTLPQSLGSHENEWNGNCPHPEIRTERLIIRPLVPSDLIAFHRLRSQPEFMKHTTSGRPDSDIHETQEKLGRLISAPSSPDAFPFYTYFGIFLKTTGELIGDGGVHKLASPACGWPELGCKLGREYCGLGYGTEFLRAFTAWWWGLPRYREDGAGGRNVVPMQVRVHPDSVVWDQNHRDREGHDSMGTDELVIEQLYAWITPENLASQRMVVKTGLEHFTTWEHPVKKIPVLGWRQSRYQRSVYPSKL